MTHSLCRFVLLCLLSAITYADPTDQFAGTSYEAHTVIVAPERTTLSSRIAALVLEMAVDEGQTFDSGQILVKLDCTPFQAEVLRSKAQFSGAQARHDANLELVALNAVGDVEVAQSEAVVDELRAALSLHEWQMAGCEVFAPYAGVVLNRSAQRYGFVERGAPLLEIVSLEALYAEVVFPSEWLRRFRPGHELTLHLAEYAAPISGVLLGVIPDVDAVARTVRGRVRLPERLVRSGRIMPGMSGNAEFAASQIDEGKRHD